MGAHVDREAVADRARPGRLLGDVIVELGFCDRQTVEQAVRDVRASGRPMGQLLVARHMLRPDQLAIAIAERFELSFVDLRTVEPDATAMALVPPSTMRRLDAVPIGFVDDGSLTVAMADPRNLLAVDDLAMLTERKIVPVVVTREDLDALLARMGRLGELSSDAGQDEADVAAIVAQALQQGVSAIHFDPDEGDLLVRYRVDGVMRDVARIPSRQAARVMSRIKILSDLDPSERRAAQDGHTNLTLDGRRIEIRVAIVPLVDGESAVLRVIDPGERPLALDEIGMGETDRGRVAAALERGHGALLATGPTCAGLTTTLYAALGLLATPDRTIITIEDPVEHRLPRLKQMQVFERAGITFASGLRAAVRADPDVVMVGELRDRDCAKIAIEAALTGRLLLSSLHTKGAAAAPGRLVDMGIEPYLVASALECVVGQRLARRLCPHCRRAVTVPGSDVGLANAGDLEIFEPGGCARCGETGYRGRIGLFEVMAVSDEIRALVVSHAPPAQVARVAVAEGMRTLRDDGLAKVRAGETSRAEIARVTG